MQSTFVCPLFLMYFSKLFFWFLYNRPVVLRLAAAHCSLTDTVVWLIRHLRLVFVCLFALEQSTSVGGAHTLTAILSTDRDESKTEQKQKAHLFFQG